jgi:hypothetical protein
MPVSRLPGRVALLFGIWYSTTLARNSICEGIAGCAIRMEWMWREHVRDDFFTAMASTEYLDAYCCGLAFVGWVVCCRLATGRPGSSAV